MRVIILFLFIVFNIGVFSQDFVREDNKVFAIDFVTKVIPNLDSLVKVNAIDLSKYKKDTNIAPFRDRIFQYHKIEKDTIFYIDTTYLYLAEKNMYNDSIDDLIWILLLTWGFEDMNEPCFQGMNCDSIKMRFTSFWRDFPLTITLFMEKGKYYYRKRIFHGDYLEVKEEFVNEVVEIEKELWDKVKIEFQKLINFRPKHDFRNLPADLAIEFLEKNNYNCFYFSRADVYVNKNSKKILFKIEKLLGVKYKKIARKYRLPSVDNEINALPDW